MRNDYMRAFVDGTPAAEGPIRFVAGTEGMKVDGRSFLMAGADLARYEANPVVLWAHDGEKPPIGRGAAAVVDGKLIIDIEFDPDDEFARSVESKYRRGFMNAVSMLPLPAGHRRGLRPRSGEIAEWELVEVSAVPIPVDPDAVKVGRSLLYRAGQDLLELADARRELSANDKRDRLGAQLTERFGGPEETWVWVRDFGDDWVVYEVEDNNGCTYYRLGYTVDENDDLTLSADQPEEVEITTTYEPVTAPQDPSSQGDGEAMRALLASLDLEGFGRSTPAPAETDLETLSAIAAALPTPKEGNHNG